MAHSIGDSREVRESMEYSMMGKQPLRHLLL
jgi:hypothetical protein